MWNFPSVPPTSRDLLITDILGDYDYLQYVQQTYPGKFEMKEVVSP